ncbi:uncharacterized protein JN550_001542 [Neoarthrinium moseri]|uniref:uncharacterized protein n=1 Tax=Neoarthrinium moseri TaxID=1658444 RepID=UPI001FDB7A8D|nr:uncharacterized protein JN550_001542 [Neoarthrinium moseri]KAI1876046.1 hypothetical protein JN550_001542 [Neoarthrinium moseri]
MAGKGPLLVFVAAPAAGHVNPLLRVASTLIKQGFEALFLSSPEFQDQITRAGAEWSPLEPFDFSCFSPAVIAALNVKMPCQLMAHAFEHIFVASIPRHTQQLRKALEMLHRRDPARQVLVIHEFGAMAVHSFYFGSPLPEGYTSFPKTICLGINPILFDSEVTGYAGPGLPFDDTPTGRARNKYILELVHNFAYRALGDAHIQRLKETGCTSWPENFRLDDFCLTSDIFLQLCGPSFEYPDPTRSPKVRFIGTLPPKGVSPDLAYPSWWPEVTGAAGAGKQVVFVAQGTLDHAPERTLLPAIRAHQHRTDVIVVVAVGQRGGKLPDDFPVPVNTHVLDYFPYDAVLPYADVFIFNAGYGGASHAVGNGVPMVVLGELGQEKAEVAARIEYSGLGLVIRTPEPVVEEVKDAVERVLGDEKFKKKALELQKESRELDPMAQIERQIEEFTV